MLTAFVTGITLLSPDLGLPGGRVAKLLWGGELYLREHMKALLERQTQLEQLDGLLAEAARGCGRVVALAEEAGAGKTALIEGFVGRVGARPAHPAQRLRGPVSPRSRWGRSTILPAMHNGRCRRRSMSGRGKGCGCFPTLSKSSRPRRGLACW